MGYYLDFVRFPTRTHHGCVTRCTCGEPEETELTSTHALFNGPWCRWPTPRPTRGSGPCCLRTQKETPTCRARVQLATRRRVGRPGASRWPARVTSRSISPPWGLIRFRLALRTYAPWGVRVVSQTKSRKIPTRNIYRSFSRAGNIGGDEQRGQQAGVTGIVDFHLIAAPTVCGFGSLCTRWEPFNFSLMGAQSGFVRPSARAPHADPQ